MKKLKVITIFVFTVLVGLFLLNELMVGIPGIWCYCVNSTIASQECQAACELYGGCDGYRIATGPGYCYWPKICVTHMYNFCKDETPYGTPIIRDGYHYYDNCSWCDGL